MIAENHYIYGFVSRDATIAFEAPPSNEKPDVDKTTTDLENAYHYKNATIV
jgi:hypothetical protein